MRLKIYLFFLAIYCLTTAGHIYTVDSLLNYAVTKSLAEEGSLAIPRFMMTVEGIDGRHYSKLGIGQSIVGLPFYFLGKIFERSKSKIFGLYSKQFIVPHEGTHIISEPQSIIRISVEEGSRIFFVVLANCFVCAGVCLLFWISITRFGIGPAKGFLATSVLGLSTPLWIYSRDFFSDPLFTLGLLGSFIFITREDSNRLRSILLASVFSSVGILARLTFLPIVLIMALYIFLAQGKGKEAGKKTLVYLCSLLPVVVAIAILNLRRFGSITLTGYHTAFDKGFSFPLIKGVVWNLFSPYRGLFIYAPAVLIFFLGLKGFYQKRKSCLLFILAISALQILIYSKWWAWHGGWCWGPRFLLPIVPLLLLVGFGGRWEDKAFTTAVAIVLSVIGILFQVSCLAINYTAIYDYWIKIGKLDWAEAGIEKLFPLGIHLRAMLSTDPLDYDIWIVQALRESTWAYPWLLGWICVAVSSMAGMVKCFKSKGEALNMGSQ